MTRKLIPLRSKSIDNSLIDSDSWYDNIDLDKEVVKEAKRWALSNKEFTLSQKHYSSPRISSEAMDCSMPLTFDQYNLCSMGCAYCFSYNFKINNPAIQDFGLKSVNYKQMIRSLNGDVGNNKMEQAFWDHFYSKKFLIHWGGMADPFCSFEKHNKVGLELIKALGKLNYPTLFSFKGNAILGKPWMKVFEKYSHQKNFAFQISMVTRSDKVAKLVEIGVPSPTKRLEVIKILSDMGYYTILRLRPFIMGLSEETLDDLLQEALDCGIKGVSVEFFALDVRCPEDIRKRTEWIGTLTGVSNIFDYYRQLSPKGRGGYQRLNRIIKEPHIKKIYKFCINNNLVFACSDPDFKELCTSGSCCGMPDNYKENRGLENWNKNQLTYHLKELRKEYHKHGVKGILTFSEVYKDTSYFDDNIFVNHNHKCLGLKYTQRTRYNFKRFMLETWNNLRSAANPTNYFHGKVLPYKHLDKDGNLQFQYNVSEYENYWNIDLTT